MVDKWLESEYIKRGERIEKLEAERDALKAALEIAIDGMGSCIGAIEHCQEYRVKEWLEQNIELAAKALKDAACK